MRVSYGWSMIFMFFLTGVSASGMPDPAKDLRLIDTIYLPGETVCYEDRSEVFFTECDTIVSLSPGLHDICCMALDSAGNAVIYCKEFFIREKSESGAELYVICEEDPFPDPDWPYCGILRDTLEGGGLHGCDSVTEYTLIVLKPRVELFLPGRQGRADYIEARVSPYCPQFRPAYKTAWIDRRTGEILAFDTYVLKISGPGEYCFLIQAEYLGQLCQPAQYCVTVKGPVTKPQVIGMASVSGGGSPGFGNEVFGSESLDPFAVGKLDLSPNPTSGLFTVHIDPRRALPSRVMIRATDLAGRVMYEKQVDGEALLAGCAVDLSGIASGVYFIAVEGEGVLYSGRVVVRR